MLKFEIDPAVIEIATPVGQPKFQALLNELRGFADHPSLEPLLAGAADGKCLRVTIEVADWTEEAGATS